MLKEVLIIMRRNTPLLIVVFHVKIIFQAPLAPFLAITGIKCYLSHIDTKKAIQFKSMNAELLKEVVSQMEKDLALSGLNHEFVANEPEALMRDMTQLVRTFDHHHNLANLLYRVDLNYDLSGIPDYSDLAERLWDRVLKKVWTRKLLSDRELNQTN